GEPVEPRKIGWEDHGRYRLFAFAEKLPAFDPAKVGPAGAPERGWREVARDIFVHGPERALLWIARAIGPDGRPGAEFVLTWAEGAAEPAVEPLRRALAARRLEPFQPPQV